MKRLNIFLLLLFSACILSAQNNIIEWRYDRTGIYSNESGLLKSWPANGPELLWHCSELGAGHSSVSIAQNKLFVTGEIDGKGYLYVLNMDGELLHKVEYGDEFTNSYPGSRSTVIPNDGKLYVVSGKAELFCYDIQSLDLLWKKNYVEDYEIELLKHGWHGPPLIVGEKLIIVPGGKKYNIVALNKVTGEIIWSSEGVGDAAGYNAPIYISDQQVPQVVTMMFGHIVGVDITDGKLLWSHPYPKRSTEHPNTPGYSDNMLFTTSARIGTIMLRLTNGGRNVERVWNLPEMDNRTSHAMRFGDYIYGAGEKINWYCVEWQTGKIMYSDKSLSTGNIIAADGMLYIYSEKGEMALVKPNPEEFEIISKFSITLGTEQHWAHPVIYQGVLYVRHGDTLMAYKIK